MGWHPLNLALRFVLELVAWGALGYWGWTQHQGVLRWLLAIGLPLLAMAAWGTFRVPGDPKDAPVAVPGLVRLALELVEFGLAAVLLYAAGQQQAAIIFAVIVALHYLASYDRIAWLLAR
ncbi:MAG: YrdB family protein [Anaerolineae bacterium]|nr:YrdB family protein [Anaerolineae bacterium]